MFSRNFVENVKERLEFNLKWLKINPSLISILGLVFGIISVYYLFNSVLMFGLFFVLHVLCDVLDGNLARSLGVSSYSGFLMDFTVDRIVQFFVMLKYYLVFGNMFVVLVFYVLHNLLFFVSDEVYYTRTLMGVLFIFGFFYLGMILVGLVTFYGLAVQLKKLYK